MVNALRARQVLVVVSLCVAGLALGACGVADSAEPRSTGAEADLSDFETEVAVELAYPDVGMTGAEAACLAVQLADGAHSVQDALDKTAPYETLSGAIEDLAPGCFEHDRLAEIEAAYESISADLTEARDTATIGIWTDTFTAGGASQEEAACLAAAQVADINTVVPIYVEGELTEQQLEAFYACGTSERVTEIFSDAYSAPLRQVLTEAGATDDEAECLVAEVGQIDLWFPAKDVPGGTDNEEMTADVFAETSPACGDPDRLRDIALDLHRR